MDAELATAKAIQESALPRVFPPYPDILKFNIYATMKAAREVGGDFYDFFLMGDDADGAEQSDDITILALEVGVPPEEGLALTVRAEASELARVNEFIHAELDSRLCPVRVLNKLDIAVEELFVNVCRYAYSDDVEQAERTVVVTCAYSADPPSVKVELVDGGVPFNPLAVADADRSGDVTLMPIGGLGILMARKSVDEMAYERTGERNVVTIVKRW